MKATIRSAPLARARLLAGALLLVLLAPAPLRGQERAPEYFFYRPGQEFGSTTQFGPVSAVVNRGFSTIVWAASERRPHRIDWEKGWTNVWESLTHPARVTQSQGGVVDFMLGEFGPKGGIWEWAFASNYMGHVIGGGITYRGLA